MTDLNGETPEEVGTPVSPRLGRCRADAASRRSRCTRRVAVIVAAVAAPLLGLGAGGAWAYFTTHGTGTGAATVGTSGTVTLLDGTATPTSLLQPGANAGITFTLTNPNPYSVTLISIAQGPGSVAVKGGTGCTAANATVRVVASDVKIVVPPGTHPVHIDTGATMGLSAADGCQGATFGLPIILQVKQ